MEAFVKNVPSQANEKILKKHLDPHMSRLSIHTYSCLKAPGKTFATLTFLRKDDCLRFLTQHGQVGSRINGRMVFTTAISQLRILDIPIYCTPSNRELDPFHVRSLELESNQKSLKLTEHKSDLTSVEPDENGNLFQATSFSCGVWSYEGSELVFVSYLDWEIGGQVRFGPRKMLFKSTTGLTMEMNFNSIQHITAVNEPNPSMTFTLSEAPHFAEENPLAALADLMGNLTLTGLKRPPAKFRVSSFGEEHEKIVAGCLVYRFTFEPFKFRQRLSNLRIITGFPHVGYHRARVRRPSESWQQQLGRLRKVLAEDYRRLPFEVLFQIQKLSQNGYLLPGRVVDILPHISLIWSRSKLEITVTTLKRFAASIQYPGPEVDASEFTYQTLVARLNECEAKVAKEQEWMAAKQESDNVAIIHRATVTPAGIYLFGPEAENQNRVLRKYPDYHDYFLRVQFADEDLEPVRFDPRLSLDNIFYGRFKNVLDDGIQIAGRKYAFLGFSHSSLRSQTCWFMAPFVHNDELVFDRLVIERLGDFKSIRSPAKCAARIGQAFSETPNVIPLGTTKILTVADVQRGEHVFSDGVGSFSSLVLEKIWDALPRKRLVKPFLFQIRHRGAKGMLALDPRLEGDVLCLRHSMVKFPVPETDKAEIELCGAAYKPLPMYLNRQLIKIMEDLKFDSDWFLKMQSQAVEALRSSTLNAKNAAKFLEAHQAGDIALVPRLIKKFGYCNWPFQEDEFLFSVVETAVMVELRALKHRTRIPIKNGATLYGIMDETGTLEEGEIFCIMDTEDYTPKVITGNSLVITRSPALHPGDVRLVKGVSLPATHPLMKLRNCIVFSQKGKRDLPSMLSGGDLDGDLYNIIWDREAQPKLISAPAAYPRAVAIDIGRQVGRSDMTDFFVKFMATDQLGRIAILHQVLSDQKDLGTFDPSCILLAEMHSTAVDFSKTGIPVDTSKMPKYSRFRPDFMAPGPQVKIQNKEIIFSDQPAFGEYADDDAGSFQYYKSDKILGQLYRDIDERDVFKEAQQHSGRGVGSRIMQRAFQYVLGRCRVIQWEHLKEWARDIREMYEDCIIDLIAKYSPNHLHSISEIEVVVGNILGKTGAPSRHLRELSTSMKEEFDRDVTFTINSIIKEGNEKSEEALERSLACFAVACEDSRSYYRGETLRSFLYVAAAVCFRELEG